MERAEDLTVQRVRALHGSINEEAAVASHYPKKSPFASHTPTSVVPSESEATEEDQERAQILERYALLKTT